MLVKKVGEAIALELRATGIPYAFAPSLAVIYIEMFPVIIGAFIWMSFRLVPFCYRNSILYMWINISRFVEIQDGDYAMKATEKTQVLSDQWPRLSLACKAMFRQVPRGDHMLVEGNTKLDTFLQDTKRKNAVI